MSDDGAEGAEVEGAVSGVGTAFGASGVVGMEELLAALGVVPGAAAPGEGAGSALGSMACASSATSLVPSSASTSGEL